MCNIESSIEPKQAFCITNIFTRDDSQTLLPIACRFVPFDQWLVSHIDTSWRIKEVKHWLLRKCNALGTRPPQPPKFRPASPVTFAGSTRSSRTSLDSLSQEDGDDDEWDMFAFDYNRDVRAAELDAMDKLSASYTPGRSASPDTDTGHHHAFRPDIVSTKFALFSFSNGHVLDDDACLSWYKLRPFELLELHRLGTIVPLPRSSHAYVEPYFDSPALVLDSIPLEGENMRRARRLRHGKELEERHRVEWKARWVVIREGVLSLSKAEVGLPTHKFPLSALCALRGADQLGASAASHPRTICAKFASPTTPRQSSESYDHYSRQHTARLKSESSKSGTWVVLDMPDDYAYENMVRVLHRLAPYPISSTFVPNPIYPKTPMPSPATTPTSSPITLDPPAFAVEFPEWRILVIDRARRAGLGDLSPAIARALYGPEEDRPIPRALSRTNSHLASLSGHTTPTASTASHASTSSCCSAEWLDPADGSDGSDVESEVEWEGWARDLGRRAARPPPQPLRPVPSLTNSSSPTDHAPLDHALPDTGPHGLCAWSAGADLGPTVTIISSGGTVRARASTAAAGTGSHPGASTLSPASAKSVKQAAKASGRSQNGSSWAQSADIKLSTPTPSLPGRRSNRGHLANTSLSVDGAPSPSPSSSQSARRGTRGNILSAFSTDRFVRGLEDALDFVDGK